MSMSSSWAQMKDCESLFNLGPLQSTLFDRFNVKMYPEYAV